MRQKTLKTVLIFTDRALYCEGITFDFEDSVLTFLVGADLDIGILDAKIKPHDFLSLLLIFIREDSINEASVYHC